MKNKFTLTIVVAMFTLFNSIAQITTQIQDVLVNNQTTVNNCGLIDFGSTTNNTLTVSFKLSKPASQVVSGVEVKVLLKYSSTTDPSTLLGPIVFLISNGQIMIRNLKVRYLLILR